MRDWYTNAEIAALDLPGFPATEAGVAYWLKQKDLDTRYPHKVRRRKGRGGGVERHVTLLPRALQSLLAIRDLKTAEAEAIPVPGAHEPPEPPSGPRGELRRDAILLLLNLWDIFRARRGGSVDTSRHLFVALLGHGRVEGLPGWAQEALTRRAGQRQGIAVNTLRHWEQKRERGDFAGLSGRYGNRKGSGVLDTAEGGRVGQRIAAWLVKQPHLTAAHIRDLVRDAFGDTLTRGDGAVVAVPSKRSFERFIAAWRAEHQEALLKLTDPDGWKSQQRFSGTRMNHWVARPNQLWEIDASPADVLLTDGRYSLYAVIDIYTRRLMISVTKTPQTAAVLALLRRAILAWGVPEILRTDNGSDFISHAFRRALSGLAIHQDITAPFSPEQKGTVERAIGTVQRGLMPLLPGFIGHNVADRQQIEARRAFAQRLGESADKAFCVELTRDELQARIDHWLSARYAHQPHGGLRGQTPFEAVAGWSGPIRRIENERALDLLLAPIVGKDGFRTVTKFGVSVDKAHYIHAALVPGQRVFCRQDPEDMGRIMVYGEDGREFICVAECPERLGVDPGQAARAVRDEKARRMNEGTQQLRRDVRSIKARDLIDGVLRVAERDSAALRAFPQPSAAHTTPELEAAQEALEVKAGPVTPESRALTANEVRLHAEVVADLHAERRKRMAPSDDPEMDRFRHAVDLQGAVAAGRPVGQDELAWLVGYQNTPEYRSLWGLYEDFGERLFV